MSEFKTEVKVYQLDYRCDEEGCDGLMRSIGIAPSTNPPQFPHKCTKCGTMKTFLGVKYPGMALEEIKPRLQPDAEGTADRSAPRSP